MPVGRGAAGRALPPPAGRGTAGTAAILATAMIPVAIISVAVVVMPVAAAVTARQRHEARENRNRAQPCHENASPADMRAHDSVMALRDGGEWAGCCHDDMSRGPSWAPNAGACGYAPGFMKGNGWPDAGLPVLRMILHSPFSWHGSAPFPPCTGRRRTGQEHEVPGKCGGFRPC